MFEDVQLGGERDTAKMASDATVSYGRHGGTLGLQAVPGDVGKGQAGYQSWGQYENAHHESQGSQVTEITKTHLPMMLAILASASVVPVMLFRPRRSRPAHGVV